MQYTFKQTTAFMLFFLNGRLTFEDHRSFANIISAMGAAGDRDVIFDVAAVDYVDSSGLGMLIVAHETALKNGGAFRIRNATGQFKDLAQRVRANHIMAIG